MAISFVSINCFIFLMSIISEILKALNLKTSVFWNDTSQTVVHGWEFGNSFFFCHIQCVSLW